MNEPKVVQMNKVLYKQFRVTCSKGKPVIIKNIQSFCNEMNVTDRCTSLRAGCKITFKEVSSV